jgi:methylmalonyl-CoA mutase
MTETPPITALAAGFEPADRARWVALVEKSLKGGDFERRLVSRTLDGIRIEPLYTRAQAVPGADDARPGQPPFTRGSTAARPSGVWDIRQFHSETDPAAANAAILEDLEGGVTSIALHISAPGTSGLRLEPGAIARALDGVLLDVCPVALVAGENFEPAARQLIALWDAKGIDRARRLAHFGGDPLGMIVQSGRLGAAVSDLERQAVRLMLETADDPGVTAMVADGHPYHAAGASDAQELAAMLATLVAYLRAAERDGIAPADALPKIAVALAADADQFSTIAKLRAARHLVWRVAEACGAGAAAGRVHLATVTAWRMMARRDPWTNMLRTTMACAAAAIGGADAITVLPFTFALGRSDRFARRIARNTQLVLAEESSLGRVTDPTGGSWYVETLTAELAAKAWSTFQEIEAEGGMAAALRSGLVQDQIAAVAAERQTAVATGRLELTGVSAFPLLGPDGVTVEPWPRAETAAAPAVDTLRPLPMHRLAEPFEALRDTADDHAARTGKPPEVFLASLGEIADHTIRSTWIKNYLAAGGIAALTSDGYAGAEDAVAAFKASGARAACICSSDAVYADHAEPAARALKAAGASPVLMAGRPGEREAALRAAGVDQFLSAGLDAVSTLRGLQSRLTAN